jgi:hypothetical protein
MFIPAYRVHDGDNFKICYMWSGLFGIDFKIIKHHIDFNLGLVDGIPTDVAGRTHYLLKENYTRKYIESYGIYNNDKVLETILNVNAKILYHNNHVECVDEHINNDRTFPYQTPNVNYYDNQKKEYMLLLEKIEYYNFPKPYNIDFIKINNIFPIIHLKSFNWSPDYFPEHITLKKEALFRLLKG